MPKPVELEIGRRQMLKAALMFWPARNILPEISFQTDQVEQKTERKRSYLLGQAVTVDYRGRVGIVNLAGGVFREFGLPLQFSSLRRVKISPDGTKVAIWAENERGIVPLAKQLFIADISSSNPNFRKIYEEDSDGTPSLIHWAPDGNWLAVQTEHGRFRGSSAAVIRLRDGKTWNFAQTALGNFSPDSSRLVAFAGNEAILLNLTSLESQRLVSTERFLPRVVWSADSRQVAIGPALFNLETQNVETLPTGAKSLGFSPDGKLLVYTVPSLPLQLAVLDITAGIEKLSVSLPDQYQYVEVAFLNTQEFQVVARTQEGSFLFSEENLFLLQVDGTSGQIADQKYLKLPPSLTFKDRLTNPDWMSFHKAESDQRDGLYLIFFKTPETVRVPMVNIGSTDEYDFQAAIAREGQLVNTGSNYYLIQEGKRDKLVGGEEKIQKYSGQESQALSTTESIVSTLAEGKTIFLDGRTRLAFVGGLTGTVETGAAGKKGKPENGLTLDFQIKTLSLGYTEEDFITVTWAGFEVNPKNGLYYAKEQTCWDTFSHPEVRADVLVDFMLKWFAQHPNDKLIILTHSEGAQPALIAINRIRRAKTRNKNYPLNPSKLTFILTHAPVLGVDKPGLEAVARIIPWISDDCKLVGDIPDPEITNQRVVEHLLETWDRRHQRKKEIEEDVLWLKREGGRIAGVGYDRDRVIAARYSSTPEPILELLLRTGILSNEVIKTQEVPGGENYMLSVRKGNLSPLRHDVAWKTPEGISLLLKLVGPQA